MYNQYTCNQTKWYLVTCLVTLWLHVNSLLTSIIFSLFYYILIIILLVNNK